MGKYLPGKEDWKKSVRRKSSWVIWAVMGAIGFALSHFHLLGGAHK